jgi:hypothetical protein
MIPLPAETEAPFHVRPPAQQYNITDYTVNNPYVKPKKYICIKGQTLYA